MTDMFGNALEVGDKIVFANLVKSNYNSPIRGTLRTGIIDRFTKSGNECYVGKGDGKFFRLSSAFILKYAYPVEKT